MIAPFGFSAPARILFGRGQAEAAPALIKSFGSSVLLVHGASRRYGAGLTAALRDSGCAVTCLSCATEPDQAMLETALAASGQPDVVVAIGGGAVLDMGKALAALIPAPGPVMRYLEVVGEGRPLEATPLPFVAMATTSGTGAEVTKNAVIGVPDAGRKVSLRDNRMLADLAITDPSLTDGCPKSVTLASGLDAVTQVIEPYISCKANPMTDALCRAAIPMGLQALRRLMQGEDRAARDQMSYVSLCGGLALANSGLGAVHGLAGVIGGQCGAAHGAVCGVLLPHVLAANDAADPGNARIKEVRSWIASAFDVAPDQACDALAAFSAQNRLPKLSEMGLAAAEHQTVAEAAGASSSMRGNPVPLPVAQLVKVLVQAG
jgi:alcohol dehydrogenase class IV